MSVKRYDLVTIYRGHESLDEMGDAEDGTYVRHDDYAELESKLETALRECRSAGITIDNLEAKCAALAAEQEIVNADNAYLRDQIMLWARECDRITYNHTNKVTDAHQSEAERDLANTYPASSSFLAEVRAQGVEMFADHLLCPDLDDTIRDFASQLRKGGNQ